jgi:hypothetical protein
MERNKRMYNFPIFACESQGSRQRGSGSSSEELGAEEIHRKLWGRQGSPTDSAAIDLKLI